MYRIPLIGKISPNNYGARLEFKLWIAHALLIKMGVLIQLLMLPNFENEFNYPRSKDFSDEEIIPIVWLHLQTNSSNSTALFVGYRIRRWITCLFLNGKLNQCWYCLDSILWKYFLKIVKSVNTEPNAFSFRFLLRLLWLIFRSNHTSRKYNFEPSWVSEVQFTFWASSPARQPPYLIMITWMKIGYWRWRRRGRQQELVITRWKYNVMINRLPVLQKTTNNQKFLVRRFLGFEPVFALVSLVGGGAGGGGSKQPSGGLE